MEDKENRCSTCQQQGTARIHYHVRMQIFEIKSLEYVVNNSTPSKSTFSKTVTVKNTSAQEKAMNVPFDFYEMETSYFNRNYMECKPEFYR